MAAQLLVQVSDSLRKTKELVAQLVRERMTHEDYGSAKVALECAQLLDTIATRLNNGNAPVPTARPAMPGRRIEVVPKSFPYYYRDGDRLVKIGKSDEGDGTYRHDVPSSNFDEIVRTLVEFSKHHERFDTKELQSQNRIPHHQPLSVLAILEEQGLPKKMRRGQWAFVDRAGFAVASQSAWGNIHEH